MSSPRRTPASTPVWRSHWSSRRNFQELVEQTDTTDDTTTTEKVAKAKKKKKAQAAGECRPVGSRLHLEFVTQSAHGHQHCRLRRIGLDLGPQAFDVDVQRLGVADVIRTPDPVDQLPPRQNPSRVAHQQGEQFELLSGSFTTSPSTVTTCRSTSIRMLPTTNVGSALLLSRGRADASPFVCARPVRATRRAS